MGPHDNILMWYDPTSERTYVITLTKEQKTKTYLYHLIDKSVMDNEQKTGNTILTFRNNHFTLDKTKLKLSILNEEKSKNQVLISTLGMSLQIKKQSDSRMWSKFITCDKDYKTRDE